MLCGSCITHRVLFLKPAAHCLSVETPTRPARYRAKFPVEIDREAPMQPADRKKFTVVVVCSSLVSVPRVRYVTTYSRAGNTLARVTCLRDEKRDQRDHADAHVERVKIQINGKLIPMARNVIVFLLYSRSSSTSFLSHGVIFTAVIFLPTISLLFARLEITNEILLSSRVLLNGPRIIADENSRMVAVKVEPAYSY